jgi:hypothetical protein
MDRPEQRQIEVRLDPGRDSTVRDEAASHVVVGGRIEHSVMSYRFRAEMLGPVRQSSGGEAEWTVEILSGVAGAPPGPASGCWRHCATARPS